MSRTAQQVQELAQPIAERHGVELWDVEFVKEGANWVLRVILDSEAGISHAECEAVSRELDGLLDARDWIDHPYVLEVSSPGAERPLRDARDFARFAGKTVMVKTFAPVDGKKEWVGTLGGLVEGAVRLTTPQGELVFPQEKVSLVRLCIELGALKSR